MWHSTFTLLLARYYVVARSHYNMAKQARANMVTPDNLIEYLAQLQSKTHQALWSDPSAHRRASCAASESSHAGSGGRNYEQTIASNDIQSTLETTSINILVSTDSLPGTPVQQKEWSATRGFEMEPQSRLTRWLLSDLFYVAVICTVILLLVICLTLMSTLFTRLKLSNIYYNCFNGVEFLPHIVITGVFAIIIEPIYGVLIWRYQDAYGIRNSLFVALMLGVLFWSSALAWRLVGKLQVRHISAGTIFVGQIVFVHILFIMVPLVKSIKFSRMHKNSIQHAENNSESGDVRLSDASLTIPRDTTRQAFLTAMQTPDDHEKIRHFAKSCFCTEMITFLDVYLAFKCCVFQDMQSRHAARDQELLENANSSVGISPAAPSIIIAKSNIATDDAILHQQSPANRMSNPVSICSCDTPRTKNSGMPVHIWRQKLRKQRTAQDNANIHNPFIGIVDTMKQVYPDKSIDGSTMVVESLRPKLDAIISTFILPNSPLELNIDSHIIDASKSYIKGGQIPYDLIDQAKDQMVELLYSNVYIRFCHS
ncbi:hypothetical protein LPJ66_000055 [Kickxella alabastrina]|uniref:Uncharacterized protein n=1 Tax=Kickxella alabastrina TaxID=61397 RepID=A0ACC1IXH2_9FUNG|nr:hypothetical protein LPJ66_000055 [Kickxella alabastrina]